MTPNQRRSKRNENYQMLMEATYRKCVEKERVREAQHRLYTKQGRFDAAMARFDLIQGTVGVRGGTTLGSVVATQKKVKSLAARSKGKLDVACQRLCRNGREHLVRVLRLIAKNGKNREESICELMKDDAITQATATSTTANSSVNSSALTRPKKGLISVHPKKK